MSESAYVPADRCAGLSLVGSRPLDRSELDELRRRLRRAVAVAVGLGLLAGTLAVFWFVARDDSRLFAVVCAVGGVGALLLAWDRREEAGRLCTALSSGVAFRYLAEEDTDRGRVPARLREAELLAPGVAWTVNGERSDQAIEPVAENGEISLLALTSQDVLWQVTWEKLDKWNARPAGRRLLTDAEREELWATQRLQTRCVLVGLAAVVLLTWFAVAAGRVAGGGWLVPAACLFVVAAAAFWIWWLRALVRWIGTSPGLSGEVEIYRVESPVHGLAVAPPLVVEVLPHSHWIWSVNGLPTAWRKSYDGEELGRLEE